MCVKIPLLHDIKYVPIYNNLIKDKFFKNHGRRKRDTPTINVVEKLSNLMLGRVILDGIIVANTMSYLGAAVNVMTKEAMLNLNLQGALRKMRTLLPLADRSVVAPEGIVEDFMVSIDSCEYPTNFLVLEPKTKFNGYPLILGTPWLASVDSYISYRARIMTIKNEDLSKQLVLYPPTQPSIEHDSPLWLEEEEEDELYHTTPYPIFSLDIITRGEKPDEDDLIDHILQIQPPTSIPNDELMK